MATQNKIKKKTITQRRTLARGQIVADTISFLINHDFFPESNVESHLDDVTIGYQHELLNTFLEDYKGKSKKPHQELYFQALAGPKKIPTVKGVLAISDKYLAPVLRTKYAKEIKKELGQMRCRLSDIDNNLIREE